MLCLKNMTDIAHNARALMAPGKGILAADESIHTADKRLSEFGVDSTVEMRKKYRELFLDAPGIEQYLSGVILFAETFAQSGEGGKTFPVSLAERNVAPGIKVDEGTEPFAENPDELITKGLLTLPERLKEFTERGAVFTKWRAVVRIDGERLPTSAGIVENVKRLANYARVAQEAGLVPILEPEVLLEGRHSRMRSREVVQETLGALFSVLEEHSVDRSGIILKTSMVLSGNKSGKIDTPEEVADDTLSALLSAVPKDTAGIVFLSGGQTPDQATENLSAILSLAHEKNAPWPLTFSFARALQQEALSVWKGDPEQVSLAREVFLERLKKVSLALAH